MKYSLEDIWNEAVKDVNSTFSHMPKGESILGSGVKIQKFLDRIEILNTSKGGDYFQELNKEEYKFFFKDGWKIGSVNLALSNYAYKLNVIEQKIKTEVNTRKNDKHIQNLKNKRESILKKYSKQTSKLNKIKSNKL
tara:strand:- start:8339 stop:8749 length:411 start_codon:yes stop_codon:yes gene_type:complete